jgi:hypothetical protein
MLRSGMRPSEAFGALLDSGEIGTKVELVDALYEEFHGLSSSVQPAVMSWSRSEKAIKQGIGLTDDRFDEIVWDFIREVI